MDTRRLDANYRQRPLRRGRRRAWDGVEAAEARRRRTSDDGQASAHLL